VVRLNDISVRSGARRAWRPKLGHKLEVYDHDVGMNSKHPPIREISGWPPPSILPSVFSVSSCKTCQFSASCRADLSRRNAVEAEASAEADGISPLRIHQRRSASISGSPVHLKNPAVQPGFSPNKKCFPLGSLPTRTALELPHEKKNRRINPAGHCQALTPPKRTPTCRSDEAALRTRNRREGAFRGSILCAHCFLCGCSGQSLRPCALPPRRFSSTCYMTAYK